MYGIRESYQHRENPAYFEDTTPDSKCWQPDVYKIAAHIARTMHRDHIVDVGCGRAHKLVTDCVGLKITGIDHGSNIAYCREQYPEYVWLERDLEHKPIAILKAYQGVMVCADVIEHLTYPDLLFAAFACYAPLMPIILTTPDRLRTYGYDHDGMPGNPHHAREWTLSEMRGWLQTLGIPVAWAGWTASEDATRRKNTMLLILGKRVPVRSMERTFDVERAE